MAKKAAIVRPKPQLSVGSSAHIDGYTFFLENKHGVKRSHVGRGVPLSCSDAAYEYKLAPYRALRGCTALLLLGASIFLPASPPALPPPPASLQIRGSVDAAPLSCAPPHTFSFEANGLPVTDSARGPLELRVPGCSGGGGAWLEPGAPAAACLAGRSFLFAGDSTTRFHYLNFINFLHAGDMLVGEPPLEMDTAAWGAGWDSFFLGSAARVPHTCDCARCEGNFLFDPTARWRVGPNRGVETLCAMENRYYVHEASGTRAVPLRERGGRD